MPLARSQQDVSSAHKFLYIVHNILRVYQCNISTSFKVEMIRSYVHCGESSVSHCPEALAVTSRVSGEIPSAYNIQVRRADDSDRFLRNAITTFKCYTDRWIKVNRCSSHLVCLSPRCPLSGILYYTYYIIRIAQYATTRFLARAICYIFLYTEIRVFPLRLLQQTTRILLSSY